MGVEIIELVIAALREAGFRTHRMYPGEEWPAITQVVAAVQLSEVDLDKRETVLEVKLLGPQSLGGAACEDAAMTAANALKDIDLSCTVGAVSFDGRTGLFSVSCIATKPEKVYLYLDLPFKLGAVEQKKVVSFTARRQTDELVTELSQAPWTVRLEQYFRNGMGRDTDPDGEPFTITNGEEIYHGCKWTSCTRTTELDGTRQIREGTATHRTINN